MVSKGVATYLTYGIVMAVATIAVYSHLRAIDGTAYVDASSWTEASSGGKAHLTFTMYDRMCTYGRADYLAIPAQEYGGMTVFVDGVAPFYYLDVMDYCFEKGKHVEAWGTFDRGIDQFIAHKVVYDQGERTIIPDTPLVTFLTLFLGVGSMFFLVLAVAQMAHERSELGGEVEPVAIPRASWEDDGSDQGAL